MTRVKVCGITARDDLRAAVNAGVDAVGVLVDVPVASPRAISPERAADLVAATPPFVTTVLVTMPTDHGSTVDLFGRVRADAVQIHGDMSPGAVSSLSADIDGDVVRAIDHDEAADYAPVADALLVDTIGDRGGGGTGRTHDWEQTRAVVEACDAPVVLAGGLTPANVRDAIDTVRPYAVDVATGVERQAGRKDHDAIHSFVQAAGGPA